jgi:hypothetical protein
VGGDSVKCCSPENDSTDGNFEKHWPNEST